MLAAARARLVLDEGGLDTRSEKGGDACRGFLKALEEAAEAFGIEPAPRTYRCQFTEKYRELFAGQARSYRVDMLEAGMHLGRSPVIWANGEQYELSGAVVELSQELQFGWAALRSALSRWSSRLARRSELSAAMRSFDEAWAGFERAYVSEITEVQEQAKHLVAEAIERERRLRAIEMSLAGEDLLEAPRYQEEVRRFVGCLSRLNAAANVQRKGRDDLSAGILEGAIEILVRVEGGQPIPDVALDVAHTLAARVVESFVSLREYLRGFRGRLDQLHPELCRNAGLVTRLVEWEESWELGARYTQSMERFSAVCCVVADIREAQRIAPAFAKMCEDCDPELFLVLPRVLWLSFLADPAKRLELMRHLLPHRFALGSGAVADRFAGCVDGAPLRRSRSAPSLAPLERERQASQPRADGELRELARRLCHAEAVLERALGDPTDSSDGVDSWDVIIRRAVGGASDLQGALAAVAPSRRKAAESAVEDLMRELERWSMELQRHCPQDWNECAGVLTQCLEGGRRRGRPAEPAL